MAEIKAAIDKEGAPEAPTSEEMTAIEKTLTLDPEETLEVMRWAGKTEKCPCWK